VGTIIGMAIRPFFGGQGGSVIAVAVMLSVLAGMGIIR